jgi:hypothetical protein
VTSGACHRGGPPSWQSIAAVRRGVSRTAWEPAASAPSSSSPSGTRPAISSRPPHTWRAVLTKSNSAYCASTDQRSLPALEHLVENGRGNRYDDEARDETRQECVTRPESVVGEIPCDLAREDEHTEEADDGRRTHVCPRRVGAARTGGV